MIHRMSISLCAIDFIYSCAYPLCHHFFTIPLFFAHEHLVAFRNVYTHVLIRVQSIQSFHLIRREFEVEYVEIGDYTFFRIGFRQGDEPEP